MGAERRAKEEAERRVIQEAERKVVESPLIEATHIMRELHWTTPPATSANNLLDRVVDAFNKFYNGINRFAMDQRQPVERQGYTKHRDEILKQFDDDWSNILAFLAGLFKVQKWLGEKIKVLVHHLWVFSLQFRPVLEETGRTAPDKLPWLSPEAAQVNSTLDGLLVELEKGDMGIAKQVLEDEAKRQQERRKGSCNCACGRRAFDDQGTCCGLCSGAEGSHNEDCEENTKRAEICPIEVVNALEVVG